MAKGRKQRKKAAAAEDDKNAPAPVAPQAPVEPEEMPTPTGPCECDNCRSNFLKRWWDRSEKAFDRSMERLVDLVLLLGKFFSIVRLFISKLHLTTYVVTIGASQFWLSMSILYYCLALLRMTGLKFKYPLEEFSVYLEKANEALAWDFRLLVLFTTGIAFVEDFLMHFDKHSPVETMKVMLNLLFAQLIMYTFIPFMDHIGDTVNVGLTLVTFIRFLVETHNCLKEEVAQSMRFLPYAFMYHCLFLSIMGLGLFYFELGFLLDAFFTKQ